MASCILPRSRFLHFPKTGGWWVCHTLTQAGFSLEKAETKMHGGGHVGHEFGDPSLPAFGFVRNPYSWYMSLYSYLKGIHWVHHPDAHSRTFEEFIRRVLSQTTTVRPMSIWVSDFFGPPGKVDFIGRFERLHEDLLLALEAVGEDFDANLITAQKDRIVNPSEEFGESVSEYAFDAIRSHDRELFARFQYSPDSSSIL